MSRTAAPSASPWSQPIAEALARRRARRDPDSPLVFHRDGIPVRRWRTAWRTACQAAGGPTRFLHDCRRTAARNLIRASVPERVAMLLTGHKTRAIFDRYNIINEQAQMVTHNMTTQHETWKVIVGVDTHKHTHVAVAINAGDSLPPDQSVEPVAQ